MKFSHFYLLFFTLLFCSTVSAQKMDIKGVVFDVDNNPLIGANVAVNEQGTITNEEGEFSLQLEAGSYDLIISYIGYQTKITRIEVDPNKTLLELNISLKESNVMLETATITATKFEQRLAESTVSIDVISSKLIETTNAVSVDMVLDKITGVQILDNQPNIRGGSGWSFGAGSRVMLLVDDIPALQGDAGLAQWDDLPVENIAQVEVVKGASSALYGSAALNGIINVRTGYATSEPETKFSIYQTRFFTPNDREKQWWTGIPSDLGINLLHKQKFGKLDVVVGGHYFNQDSTSVYSEQRFRNKKRVNLNLRYRITDRITVGTNSTFNYNNTSSYFLWANGASSAYRPFINTVTKGEQDRYHIDPYFRYYDRKNNKHSINTRLYSVDNQLNLNQSNSSRLYFGEYQFQKRFDKSNVNLTTGVATTYISSNSEVFSDTLINSRNYAYFLQLDKKLFNKLNLSVGGRYEYNLHLTPEEFNGITIPEGRISEGRFISRLGLNYQLGDYSFVRASFGQGYRFPTIAERFLTTQFAGFTIFPNPNLESETGWSSEIGIKKGVKVGGFEGFVDFAMFISEYDNMMEFTFANIGGEIGFQSQNIGNTRITGYEIGLTGKYDLLGIPVKLFGGYTYIDPVYKDFTPAIAETSSSEENVLKYRTRGHVTFDLEAEYKDIMFGAALIGASDMVAIDDILSQFANIGEYRRVNGSAYRRVDFRLSYKFKNYKLSALLNNALNEEYTERPALLEPPRNLGLRLDAKI